MQSITMTDLPCAAPESHTEQMSPIDPRSFIVSIDREKMGGTPCFIGTRIPIKHLWDYLEGGGTIAEFMDDFEGVSRD